jgi:ribosomal protein S13
MGIIPTAITGHIRIIIGLHTIGMAGIGTTVTTTIITTTDINAA